MRLNGVPRVGPPSGAQEAIGRVAPGFGWFGLGVLAAGVTAWAIFLRTGQVALRRPRPETARSRMWFWTYQSWRSTGSPSRSATLRAHVSILAELANLLNLSVGVDARLDEVKLEIEGVEAEVHLVAHLRNVRAILVEGA